MGTKLKITGVIDRSDPDPNAPYCDMIRWIGTLAIDWTHDGAPRCATAAMLRVDTGGGRCVALWGDHQLALRWIGDKPAPEIACSVFDAVLHRGPARGAFELAIESYPTTASEPSYRPLRAPAVLAR